MSRNLRMAALAILAAAVVLTPIGTTLGRGGGRARQTLQIEGSTTVGPMAVAFADWFMRNQRNVSITVKQTGSGDGAAALIDGRCDIATMSKFMSPGEFKKGIDRNVMPVAHVVAMDGVCIIVHPSNPIKNLSLGKLQDIYTGKITNWKQLGGPDRPIVAITRDTSSGTFECFQKLVMKKTRIHSKTETASSSPHVYARVKSNPSAISYVGLAFVKEGVKALKINGVLPTRKSIATGSYPVSRPLFLFTNGYPELGSLTHAYVTFHLTETGQEIVEAKGFVPLTDY